MAHGYEVKLTPLQILVFYNAIANNGVRVKPYLIQQVVDNGKVIRDNGKNIQQQKNLLATGGSMGKGNFAARNRRSEWYR